MNTQKKTEKKSRKFEQNPENKSNHRLSMYGGTHLCMVPNTLLAEYTRHYPTPRQITLHLKSAAFQKFQITLINDKDIEELKKKCQAAYYQDIGEWFREYLRTQITLAKAKEEGVYGYYVHRITPQGDELYLCKDKIAMADIKSIIWSWTPRFAQAEQFSSVESARRCISYNFSQELNCKIEPFNDKK